MKQNKIVGTIFMLFTLVCVCSHVQAQSNEAKSKALKEAAQDIVSKLAAGDFEGVNRKFSGALKQQLTADKLREGWINYTKQFGSFKKQGEAEVGKTQDGTYDEVRIKCEFEKGVGLALVAFDSEQQVIGLYIAPPQSSSSGGDGAAFKERAGKVADLMAAGDFQSVYNQFNDEMKRGLSVEQMRSVWNSAVQNIGKFKKRVDSAYVKADGYDVVTVRCEFERGFANVRVGFDSSQKIGGLYLLPAQ